MPNFMSLSAMILETLEKLVSESRPFPSVMHGITTMLRYQYLPSHYFFPFGVLIQEWRQIKSAEVQRRFLTVVKSAWVNETDESTPYSHLCRLSLATRP